MLHKSTQVILLQNLMAQAKTRLPLASDGSFSLTWEIKNTEGSFYSALLTSQDSPAVTLRLMRRGRVAQGFLYQDGDPVAGFTQELTS